MKKTSKTKKNKKMGRPRTSSKTTVQFAASLEELGAVDILEQFYGHENHHQLLRQLLVMGILDIAALVEDPKWTPQQKKAWQYCQKQAKSVDRALILCAAKEVLKELKTEDPNNKYSVRELSLMLKGKLVEMARGTRTKKRGKQDV